MYGYTQNMAVFKKKIYVQKFILWIFLHVEKLFWFNNKEKSIYKKKSIKYCCWYCRKGSEECRDKIHSNLDNRSDSILKPE